MNNINPSYEAFAAKAHAHERSMVPRSKGSLLSNLEASVDAEKTGVNSLAEAELQKKFIGDDDAALQRKLESAERCKNNNAINLPDGAARAAQTIAEVKAEQERRRRSKAWLNQV
jgi:hypothetical protein